MIGALAGDMIGSVHEGTPLKRKDFPLLVPESQFTDDTVLSVAVAHAIRTRRDYGRCLRWWARRYPDVGYGGRFYDWTWQRDARAYDSYGNGSAMRASPVGWAFDDLESVLSEAQKSAEPTHGHPEGIKGALAVAGVVYLARKGHSKREIRRFLEERLSYDCSPALDAMRRISEFNVTCQGTVPAAAIAFLESVDCEDAIRNAVSLGGDADTLACIAGAMAEAFYGGVPRDIRERVLERLDRRLRARALDFVGAYGVPLPGA